MNIGFRQRRSRRCWALKAGVSAVAVLSSGVLNPVRAADIASMLSPSGLALSAGQRVTTPAAAQAAAIANPAYQAQTALSAANLARAAQAIKDMTAAQAAARASSQLTLDNVPLSGSHWNGTTLSGLNPVDDTDSPFWLNADPLQKDIAKATATVKQTAASALLTWQSLDLNNGETLVFDQQGHVDWTVLNRVTAGPRDPVTGSRFVASPSMILGKIQASGSVYVINPNGIIFGPTAEVNVHSLIASSLDVGNRLMSQGERDAFFLNSGILGTGSRVPLASFSFNQSDKVVEGDVRIQAGATITTTLAPREVSPDAGGFVYLFAPNVYNDGTISTPAGETLLAARQVVQLARNFYPDGGIPLESRSETFRAVGLNNDNPEVWRVEGETTSFISAPGTVVNRGLIDAERGVIILNGDNVINGSAAGGPGGILRADTSITRNGQIFLDARLQLTLEGGSSVQILPTDNDETIPKSALENFSPPTIEMKGRVLSLESDALVIAPGANVSANENQALTAYPGTFPIELPPDRFYMAPEAQIDVAGLAGVSLPMSVNFLSFKPFGNEFADQPLQRQGPLRGIELTVDIRQSGMLDGNAWIGTPLANVAGFAANVQQGVNQLLTTGGTVTIANQDIILRHGSSINVGGGYVEYEGGPNQTTKLVTADGRIVSMERANPLDTYIGIAGVTEEVHPHWGATAAQTFVSSIFSHGEFEPGYIEGRDAGGIVLSGAAYVLDGSFHAGVIAGERQRLLGIRPDAATANSIAADARAMPSAGFFTIGGVQNVTIAQEPAPVEAGFSLNDLVPPDRVADTQLSASALSAAHFSRISAAFTGALELDADAVLEVVPGGTIALSGGSVDIEGQIIARSGTISVESTGHIAGDSASDQTEYVPTSPNPRGVFDLKIGAHAVLDASGLWVNDTGAGLDTLIGPAYIDGGTVSLTTRARSAICSERRCVRDLNRDFLIDSTYSYVDLTGDIVLSDGSHIDVSSGGRITDAGLFQLDSIGRPAGKGGSVALVTYAGDFSYEGVRPPTVAPPDAIVRLPGSDGTPEGFAAAFAERVSAFGFAEGGTLSIRVPGLQIGGASSDAPGVLTLPAEFFSGNAFSRYALASAMGDLTVTGGVMLTLRQQNLVADDALLSLGTGARVPQLTSVDYLPEFLRAPVGLDLSSILGGLIPSYPYDPATPGFQAKVALRVEEDAIIEGDPGAVISISVTGHNPWDPSGGLTGLPVPVAQEVGVAEILGTIVAPGGDVTLTADDYGRLWMGATSRIDVSGTTVLDTRQPLFRTGLIYSGGSIKVSAIPPASSVIGLEGAMLVASGAAGEFDLMHDGLLGPELVATPVWSDAGSIAITASTLVYDGSFEAKAGASAAKGGSLTISATQRVGPGDQQLVVLRQGNVTPDELLSTDSLGNLVGLVHFQANRLKGSGIVDLTLSASPTQGDDPGGRRGFFVPGTITFRNNVTISGLDSLALDAARITLTGSSEPVDPDGCNVCLDARYVALRGSGSFFPETGTRTLRVEGDLIDIAVGGRIGQGSGLSLSGVAEATFVSSGDIRLRVPLANVTNELPPGALPSGELQTAGDLTLQAAQVYPISAVNFTLTSIAPDGVIAFAGNGAPDSAPLSVAGRVTVNASHIEQGGILIAPLGVIRLNGTETVRLAEGSLTSVSLAGLTIPFGVTANGTSWSYNSVSGQPLTAPPAKELIISAPTIDLAEGATVDVRGGGDFYGTEFVPGTGGSQKIQARPNTYAIVPGYDPVAAPIDFEFLIQQRDPLPGAGLSVYLSGGNGLPAGYYTLLSPDYATLPGAYLVSLVGNSTDALASLNTTRPDGTSRMAGYFAQPAFGVQDPRAQFFDVRSAAVWRQYSEILNLSGNAFFGDMTVGDMELPAPLPVDAGHIVFSAVNGLNLEGIIQAAMGTGGRGAKLDIAAQDIQVLSPGGKVTNDGLLPLDATQLSNLGVESLLIGGVRSPGEDGETIDVVAKAVRIHNDEAAPLEAPEIILVTKPGPGEGDPNAIFDVRLDAGSVVRAVGDLSDPTPHTVIIGSDANDILGSGSLLAVSNAAPLIVIRENAKPTSGQITMIGPEARPGFPGAYVEGASLTLDTTGQIRIRPEVTLAADAISVAARSISFGEVNDTPGGFVVRGDILKQLKEAQTLTLRSVSGTINFYGDVNLVLDHPDSQLVLDTAAFVAKTPGFVKLAADTIELTNSRDSEDGLPDGTAALRVEADTIELGAGDKAFGGFGFVTFAGTSEIAVRDVGSVNTGSAELRFATPLFLVGAGANQAVNAANLVTFAGTDIAGAPIGAAEIGGTFAVKAPSIDLAANALIQATAGGVTLEATSGDIHLGENAKILATGYAQAFFDVTRVTGGGSVKLIADQGTINAHAASSIDVSSPVGYTGFAGSIGLTAPNGWILTNSGPFDMGIIAGSIAGDSGGQLAIQTRHLGMVQVEGTDTFVAAPLSVPSLFSDTVNIHLSRGDLLLAGDLTASNVTLTADRGLLTIDQTIDASGKKGGTISLYGGLGVVLADGGQLLAKASDGEKHGGEIIIGTQVATANGSSDPGRIDLQGGVIDVTNTANAVNGGSILLRAPLIQGDDSGVDVSINVAVDETTNAMKTQVVGATKFTVEAFKVFDTANSEFNGVIDPLAQPSFYGSCTETGVCIGTLVEFVQKFALSSNAQAKFAGIPSQILHIRPGIELVNNDTAINNGDIAVANAWNLGAGIAGYLQGVVQSRFGGTFQGYLVNYSDYKVNQITYPAGTVFTDEYGELLYQFRNYKGPLVFVDGVSVTTTAVVTDEFGNLLDQFAKYKGPLVVIEGVSELKRTVVTDQFGALLPEFSSYKGVIEFAPGVSQITSLFYRVGGEATGEPGALTLRAARDVVVNESITDGFFQTRNVFDDDYQQALAPYISPGQLAPYVTTVGGYVLAGGTYNNPAFPPPVVPFDSAGNAISPVFSGKNKTPITGADLFPLIKDENGPIEGFDGNYRAINSWSYKIAAGADTASANPLALRPLTEFDDASGTPFAGHGNVVLDGHREYNVVDPVGGDVVTYRTPTIIRTGTGSIDIAAGRDFILADTKAPGVVYTAGRNSVDLPDPGFAIQTIDDPFNLGFQVTIPVASNPSGFLKPLPLNCDPYNGCFPYGPLIQSAYPVDGGHVTLTVGRDIIGFEHPTIRSQAAGGPGQPYQQYFAPWLLAQSMGLPITAFGPFSPLSGYLSTGGEGIFTPPQTSWWINFGSFGQGLMSVGGDVRIEAGRDVQELSVSLPTTARFSGGLSSTITDAAGNEVANIPVAHINGSGDLTVIVGRDLKSGAFYEGSGEGKIVVGGSVSASWAEAGNPDNSVSTVLALDTGSIALSARGAADIAGILSGPSLQNVTDPQLDFDGIGQQSVSSYAPSSKAEVRSVAGDVILNSLKSSEVLVSNAAKTFFPFSLPAYPGVNKYPAQLEAVALLGDVRVEDALELAPSENGTLNLLAKGSLLTYVAGFATGLKVVSAGPSLVEDVFEALAPLAGFAPEQGSRAFDLGAHLLHKQDSTPDRFYAVTGDIISGAGTGAITPSPMAWEINKPARVQAAGDIVDLSFFGQNLAPTDVTQIVAGRDLTYTGAWQRAGQSNVGLARAVNLGGLSLAGPGFFDVEAGRNLGPFVTAASNITLGINLPGPDSNGTGIVTFGNTVVVGNQRMQSDQAPGQLGDQFALGANEDLPRQGADIVAMFGVANGIDYQAVITKYIDPNTDPAIASPRNYLPDLAIFLQTLGFPAQSASDAWTTFNTLTPELQHVFVDKVFFRELKLPGDGAGSHFKEFAIGYSVIGALFPSSRGYSDNGTDETSTARRVETGNVDLLHATIKTIQGGTATVLQADGKSVEIPIGGDIMLLGPGGTINVGTTAREINTMLTNSALGILTLDGGASSIFTDGSVLVNQSRILTVQGGDIVMWSSNADLDAGRGAKTTVDFKPLSVIFDPNDLQTINPNGLVSGAGIGTIKSTPDAPAASAYLIAPRGIVNAGDAGLRSSGNLSIAALLVLNAANIATVGTVTGVPDVGAVNLGALESTAAVGGQAAQVAQDAVQQAANRAAQVAPPVIPSLITVEVFIGTDPDTGTATPQQ